MTEFVPDPLSDWILAPNIHRHPEVYELENRALLRDGRLEEALLTCADWRDQELLDVGCGTGFWLPIYAQRARRVIGVEPDPALIEPLLAVAERTPRVEVRRGSAEHLSLPDASADVAHARFAYFFGRGAEAGLKEIKRVLRPGGVFVAIDNSRRGGEFAQLLAWSQQGNGAIDAAETDAWWARQGARRVEVEGGWECESAEQLERVLRIEFRPEVVERFISSRPKSKSLTYQFALFVVRKE